jgi:putative membrane protein
MSSEQRRPAAFPLDSPRVVIAPSGPEEPPRRPARGTVVITPDPEVAALAVVAPPKPRRGVPWGAMFWAAAGGLVVLGFALAVAKLVEDLFARSDALGYLALICAILAAVALLAVTIREAAGLARLHAVEQLRLRAVAAAAEDDRDAARAVVRDLIAIERVEPRLARARAELRAHAQTIIDGTDLIRLAERELMAPLDEEARRLVAAAAKRVSVVTAVSPRVAVDMAFVFITVLSLVRRLADLYGARPGALGRMRLIRLAISHLALTGGVAASDGVIQQALGHGLAAKLSARLGEGVLNGLLTARLGLAAIEVARPLPFAALPKPVLKDLVGDLFRPRPKADEIHEITPL